MSLPTFFFSHARDNREKSDLMQKFFKDLEGALEEACGEVKTKLGTIDSRIEQGEDWDKRLSESLSNTHCLVAVYSPTFFKREICGKEVFVVLKRHPDLDIDDSGALKGVTNLLPIQWLSEDHYCIREMANGEIPHFLSLVNRLPADDGSDSARTKAITTYQKKGLRRCIDRKGGAYGELLECFVNRIVQMKKLPPAPPNSVNFNTAENAFKLDWAAHFGRNVPPDADAIAAVVQSYRKPQAFHSIVVLHVTARRLSEGAVLPNQLEELPLPMAEGAGDREFELLLAEIDEAGQSAGIDVIHGATDIFRLKDVLAAYDSSNILTALVVDPAMWARASEDTISGVLCASRLNPLQSSRDWNGIILVPTFDQPPQAENSGRVFVLPSDGPARRIVLSHAFLKAKADQINAARLAHGAEVERMPLLKATGTGNA